MARAPTGERSPVAAQTAPGSRRGPVFDATSGRRRRRRPVGHLRDASEGIAAVEFALIMPLLLVLMLGGLQLVAYINAVRKVDLIARSISQMISQTPPPTGSTVATVAASDIHFSFDSALVLFPYLMKDGARRGLSWWQDIFINFASIQFTQTSTSCTNAADMSACYVANVVWTSTGTTQPSSGAAYRPCVIAQLPAANTAATNRATLPRSVYGPASVVVVDVMFTFTPTFGARFLPAVQLTRSAYVQPRYATLVSYDTTNNDGIVTKCPGY